MRISCIQRWREFMPSLREARQLHGHWNSRILDGFKRLDLRASSPRYSEASRDDVIRQFRFSRELGPLPSITADR
jgi:hypothetical protein